MTVDGSPGGHDRMAAHFPRSRNGPARDHSPVERDVIGRDLVELGLVRVSMPLLMRRTGRSCPTSVAEFTKGPPGLVNRTGL